MKLRTQHLLLGVFSSCLFFQMGCGYRTQGLFTQPDLGVHERYAIFGLTVEQEQIFMATFLKVFGKENIVFIERQLLNELVKERNLLKVRQRLDEETRAKMKEVLGVEALILCEYYDAGKSGAAKKLRVRVVNCETGEIVGSVITRAGNHFERHCVTAVTALYRDLN